MVRRSTSERVRQARVAVRRLRSLLKSSPGHLRARESRQLHELLAGAISETYRWARRAMSEAYGRAGTAAFRDWRLAVKYHGYHQALLTQLCPHELAGRLEVIERLAELLREDRDLSAFAAEQQGQVLPLIEQRQRALRALARPLGRRLFADQPAAFARGLAGCLIDVATARPVATSRRQPVGATLAHLLRPTFT
jgi:hypothetical protein